MEELLKNNFISYAFLTVFSAICFSSLVFGILKKTKKMENKKKKATINFIVSGVIICFWLWFFVYINLFPISLAYCEYNHNFVEEKIGVVENIERDEKDRIYIIIDEEEYTIVYSSTNPDVSISSDIDKGDNVKIIFGVNSKFIFNITELS